MEGAGPVRAVTRAMTVLEQFTLAQPEKTLTEISTAVGLSKSTTHRLLGTLVHTDMLEFDGQTGRYRLGLKVFRLGSVVSKGLDLLKQADPLLEELTEEIGESSFLLVADGNEALCLRRFDGAADVRVLTLEQGARSPFNCGSAQRVLLAHLPEERWREIVAHHTQRLTQYSLVDGDDLGRDRREIQERGYCVAWEDVTLHACALGAPVCDVNGEVVAAVSISGIVQRFSAERLPGLIRRIMQTGEAISRRLGYPD